MSIREFPPGRQEEPLKTKRTRCFLHITTFCQQHVPHPANNEMCSVCLRQTGKSKFYIYIKLDNNSISNSTVSRSTQLPKFQTVLLGFLCFSAFASRFSIWLFPTLPIPASLFSLGTSSLFSAMAFSGFGSGFGRAC